MRKNISNRLIDALTPGDTDYFIRDDRIRGFGLKVSPAGRVSFIAEGRIRSGSKTRTRRITLGTHPALSVAQARELAVQQLSLMQQGVDPVVALRQAQEHEQSLSQSLGDIFEAFLRARAHKPKTRVDYINTVKLVFGDWLDQPIRDISRKEVQARFLEIKEERGEASANKAMRILSAIMNYAKAEDVGSERLITENPCNVLKERRLTRRLIPRERYLSDAEIDKLIHFHRNVMDWPSLPRHGVTKQGIHYVLLLMMTGLRRSEGFGLTWVDVDFEKKLFTVRDTKNSTNHVVPMSTSVEWTLKQQREFVGDTPWVFPAATGDGHMTEPSSQLAKIKAATGLDFCLHDLRRTFATHAQAQGMDYELIRRALNHSSGGGVTSQYVITQVETLRPVFQAVADGYHTYHDPTWRINDEPELEPVDTIPRLPWPNTSDE
jgi:integrase